MSVDAAAQPDPHLLGPDLLPTPFTAAEIREASGRGKTIRLLVEGPGETRYERVNRFSECDEEGAVLARWRLDADGAIDGEVSSDRVTWLELQWHAAFPADSTSLGDEIIELPIGRLACLRYETRDTPDAPLETFWFAHDYPGMPVRYEVPTPEGLQRTTVIAVDVER